MRILGIDPGLQRTGFAVLDGEDVILALPGDPLFNDKAAIAEPDGPTRFVMRNGRFLPERA